MQTHFNRHSRGGSRFRRHRSPSHPSRNRHRGGHTPSNAFSRPREMHGRSRKLPTFDPSQFINTNPVEGAPEVYVPKHRFSTMGLSDVLVRAITARGMEQPTPIQDQIIPHVLKGKDVIGLAETGTGKTAAFLIPLIDKTLRSHNRQTLILTPTRELALQVHDELKRLSSGCAIHAAVCVGGTNIRPQMRELHRKNHFVIGTPGRILDLIDRRSFRSELVTTVVLDEADRMLDMGFIHDMRKILDTVPEQREMLLFSATMSDATNNIVHDFLHDPITVSVKKRDVTNSIAQDVVHYTHDHKFDTLTSLLKKPECKRVIVFGSMKHSVEKLAKQLCASGIKAESIHGNKSHSQRQRSLSAFKSGHAHVLVATDVAARGIHIDNVTHVINYDLPNTFEDYVHRIGRTGRVDQRGIALTFVESKPQTHSPRTHRRR